MKKTIFFLLFLLQLQAFLQSNTTQLKLQFISTEKNRVAIDSIYSYKISAKSSSGKTVHIAVKDLPDWLHFDAAKNVLYGKPLKAGQYVIDIVAAADTVIHQQFMLTVYNSATKNILVLGNSITNGTNKFNSYRRALWQLLHKGNYNFDFIGSWNKHNGGGNVPNPDFDMDHEGHSGWKASDILKAPDWDKERGNIQEWLQKYTPDVVLIELGTNEVFQCVPALEAMHNLDTIIQVLRKKKPQVKIFLAEIPPLGAAWATKKLCNNMAYGQALVDFNKAIVQFGKDNNTVASPVIIVDQYSGINTATDLYDDIHPNDQGEKKMAEKWFNAIKGYLKHY